jgi:hypothetical protein
MRHWMHVQACNWHSGAMRKEDRRCLITIDGLIVFTIHTLQIRCLIKKNLYASTNPYKLATLITVFYIFAFQPLAPASLFCSCLSTPLLLFYPALQPYKRCTFKSFKSSKPINDDGLILWAYLLIPLSYAKTLGMDGYLHLELRMDAVT